MYLTHNLGIFGSLLKGEHFAAERPALWNGLAPWSTGNHNVDLFGEDRARELARLARDGGKKYHNGEVVKPGSILVLDFESKLIEAMEPHRLLDVVLAAKDEAPEIKVGVFGYKLSLLDINLDAWAALTPETVTRFTESIETRRCVVDACDFFNGDVYLLGQKYVARDLEAYTNALNTIRETFGKPIVPFVWGAYNTAWNPPGTLLSKATLYRYAKMLRESCDGVIVWGPKSDNEGLIQLMTQPRFTELPTTRQPTWASELVPASKGLGEVVANVALRFAAAGAR
jgi:hypothetical protein